MEHYLIDDDYITDVIADVENGGPLEFKVEDIRGEVIFYTIYMQEEWEIESTHTSPSSLEIAADLMQAHHPLEDVDFEEILNIICTAIDGDSFHTNEDETLILIRGASVIVTISEESMGVDSYED